MEKDMMRNEIHLDKLEDFRIYLDQSTAEIFLNQGEKVLTMKSYFTEDTLIHMNSELQIKCENMVIGGRMMAKRDRL